MAAEEGRGRRALAAGWVWTDGVRRKNGDPCISVSDEGTPTFAHIVSHEGGDLFYCADASAVPDFDDAGTQGHALALVNIRWTRHWENSRKRWHTDVPVVTIERVHGGWRWRLSSAGPDGFGDDTVASVRIGALVDCYAEALVSGLEASP